MNPERLCRSGLGKAYKKKALQNPMVKDEYDALQPILFQLLVFSEIFLQIHLLVLLFCL